MTITSRVAMLGAAGNSGEFSSDPFIAEFSGFTGFPRGIDVDDDNYIYTLWDAYPATNYNVILLKIDPSDGSVVWSKRKFYSSNSTLPYDLAYGNNSIYVASRNVTADRQDILRFDLDGNLINQCRLSNTRFTLNININSDGDVCIFGEAPTTAVPICITMNATLSTIIRNDQPSWTGATRANTNTTNNFFSDGVSVPVWSYGGNSGASAYDTRAAIYNTSTGTLTSGVDFIGGTYSGTVSGRNMIADLSDNMIYAGAFRGSTNQFYGYLVSYDPSTSSSNWGYQFRNNSNTVIEGADIQPDTGQIVICGYSDGGVYSTYAAEHGFLAVVEEDGTRTSSLQADTGSSTKSIRAGSLKHIAGNYFAVAFIKGDRNSGVTFNGSNVKSYISLIDITNLPSGTYFSVTFTNTTSGWHFNSISNRSTVGALSTSISSVSRSRTSVSYSNTAVSYTNSVTNW